jgi:hypothetical protein
MPTALCVIAAVFDEATRPLRSGLGSLLASAFLSATFDAPRCVGLDLEAFGLRIERAPFFQLGLLRPWLLSVLREGIASHKELSFARRS